MVIHCTKKLLDALNLPPVSVDTPDPFFSWHANLLTVNRRRVLLLTNDLTQRTILLYGIWKKDLQAPVRMINMAIRETLLEDRVKSEIMDRYLADGGEILFSRTGGKSALANLNHRCREVERLDGEFCPDTLIQARASRKISRWTFAPYGKERRQAYEWFEAELGERYGTPVYRTKLFRLKITLDLKRHEVWRRVTVPYDMTFRDLHQVIQQAFGWQDVHSHEFVVLRDNGEAAVRIVDNGELFDFPSDAPLRLDAETALTEYLPKYKRLAYTYDFGDNWVHFIEFEDLVFESGQNHPLCLDGKGGCPPEDAGGEDGYESLLETLSDRDNPGYADAAGWMAAQRCREFDISLVNLFLKDFG